MADRIITVAEFEDRLAALSLRGTGSAFPRRDRDRHILYRSIVQTLDVAKIYSEGVLNEKLQQWLSDIGASIDIDHVTLRRYLVDEAYLRRDASGSRYEVNVAGTGRIEFDRGVEAVDASAVIQAAKVRVDARRRERSQRSKT